jgi:hypothetical protein
MKMPQESLVETKGTVPLTIVELSKRPVDIEAFDWLVDRNLTKNSFREDRAQMIGTWKDYRAYWRILSTLAIKKGQQLTFDEVINDFRLHERIVDYYDCGKLRKIQLYSDMEPEGKRIVELIRVRRESRHHYKKRSQKMGFLF